MRRFAVTAVLLLALAAAPLRAQTGSVPAILVGTYEHPDLAGARAGIMSILEPHIAMAPYFAQTLIRSRIEERMVIPRRVSVAVSGADVSVTYESDRVVTVTAPLGGSTTFTTRDGNEVPVTHDLHLGWLRQIFTGETGTLTVLLSTESDGATMHLDATAHGERLPADVPIRLDYVRVD